MNIKFKEYKLLTIVICIIISCSSCEKLFNREEISNTPIEVFDYLWGKVNDQYSFFDVKDVDWDSIYSTLRPQVSNSISQDSLFEICATMMNSLKDGHANLISAFNISNSEEIFLKMYSENQIDYNVVALNYLGANAGRTGGISHNSIHKGQIIYARYSSFSNNVNPANLQYIINHYPKAEGLILDLRQNGGGNVENIWNILKMIDSKGQELFQTQIKSGRNHNDFTTSKTVYAPSVPEGYTTWKGPIAVLIDRGSYSATSIFSLSTKQYPQITLIGDTTGGGLGLPNGGELPNGWTYRFSVTRTLTPDGKNYENGVPPDIYIELCQDSIAIGKDNIIEFAARFLLSQS